MKHFHVSIFINKVKETYVNIDQNDVEPKLENLIKVCQWYTEDERNWLLNYFWDSAILSQVSVVALASIGILVITMTTCIRFKRMFTFKILSGLFGLGALVNSFPLALKFTSDFCTINEGICDPSQSYCVSSCTWGSGSWQTLASSLMWISTAFTTWLIAPSYEPKKPESENDLSSVETDDSGSSQKGQYDYSSDEESNR